MDSVEKNISETPVMPRRFGFWGGSFNPPTIAHEALAHFIVEKLALDRLFWVVSPHNPEKDVATLAPFNHRFQMVKNITDQYDTFNVTDIEQRNNSSWTIDTVRSLRQEYPHDALFFMMGTDNWLGFHNWGRDYEQILDNVSLVILNRPGYESAHKAESSRIFKDVQVTNPSLLQKAGTWCIVDNPSFDMAATNVREALQRGEKPEQIASHTLDYIEQNNLYQLTV